MSIEKHGIHILALVGKEKCITQEYLRNATGSETNLPCFGILLLSADRERKKADFAKIFIEKNIQNAHNDEKLNI